MPDGFTSALPVETPLPCNTPKFTKEGYRFFSGMLIESWKGLASPLPPVKEETRRMKQSILYHCIYNVTLQPNMQPPPPSSSWLFSLHYHWCRKKVQLLKYICRIGIYVWYCDFEIKERKCKWRLIVTIFGGNLNWISNSYFCEAMTSISVESNCTWIDEQLR